LATEDEGWLPEQAPPRSALPLDLDKRLVGLDRPVHAETMIGLRRLDQLQTAVESVLDEQVAR
jgi:Macrocin-O-methyltransferase (TylF)